MPAKLKSFDGCWTCRLRRKKCDEKHPVCGICAALHITCHYDEQKPEWMDGGVKQKEMIHQLKREVKERRRSERSRRPSTGRDSSIEAPTGELTWDNALSTCKLSDASLTAIDDRDDIMLVDRFQRRSERPRVGIAGGYGTPSEAPDTVLITFYLEHVFPFLFPFYQPSPLQGGKAWILEMMIKSPVVRQAALCQSSYFFSLLQGTANGNALWETTLKQTRDAFEILRHALQVVYGSDIKEHLHGAVRILASIMQLQRFEITVLSFNNCQAHLSGALTLFKQLMDSVDDRPFKDKFSAIMNQLRSTSSGTSGRYIHVLSAEQAAFGFSSALLILDDIITSMILQKQPRLYEHHRSLLDGVDGVKPLIDLEKVVGCQNWVFLHLGEIIGLDAWKQQCRTAGNLDIMELVRRATAIKDALEAHVARLASDTSTAIAQGDNMLSALTGNRQRPAHNSSLVTCVWAHAALLHLSVVVSGWQTANANIRYHVDTIIDLLHHQISPPEMLRTMVWPFCVAGCLAEPGQEAQLRAMGESVQPSSIFSTVREALSIMENVWHDRHSADTANRDLATCFRSQGGLTLLV